MWTTSSARNICQKFGFLSQNLILGGSQKSRAYLNRTFQILFPAESGLGGS